MKFADFSEFKNDFEKFISLVKKGDDLILTKSGKPIISLAGINKDDIEDYLIAKHYKLEKKAKKIESASKSYTHKEVKKYLGL